nr:hypothetical protein [Candidatus Paceibacterota bacterium]
PYEKLRIGRKVTRPYPQMKPKEFFQWYQSEVFPYYDSDEFSFSSVLSDLVNDEVSTDEELREVWTEELDVPAEVIDKLLPMRGYFLDFRYIQNI